MTEAGDEVILVPLKRFSDAKSRLRAALVAGEVVALTRRLATGVICAAAPRPVAVLCDDDDVAAFAVTLGAAAWRVTATGLSAAVAEGYELAGRRFGRCVIAHGDLARPAGLGDYRFLEGVTVVPDHRGDGTNVLALPTGLAFPFAYGPQSADRHLAAARELGLPTHRLEGSPWGVDIDGPEDLESPEMT